MRWYALRIRYLIVSHSYALACDYASDYAKDRAGFHSFRIYAVLCDRITFELAYKMRKVLGCPTAHSI